MKVIPFQPHLSALLQVRGYVIEIRLKRKYHTMNNAHRDFLVETIDSARLCCELHSVSNSLNSNTMLIAGWLTEVRPLLYNIRLHAPIFLTGARKHVARERRCLQSEKLKLLLKRNRRRLNSAKVSYMTTIPRNRWKAIYIPCYLAWKKRDFYIWWTMNFDFKINSFQEPLTRTSPLILAEKSVWARQFLAVWVVFYSPLWKIGVLTI